MKKTRDLLPNGAFVFPNRKRSAKRRCREIATARRKEARKGIYRKLVKVAEEIRDFAVEALLRLDALKNPCPKAQRTQYDLGRFIGLVERTLDQTRRRVFQGESVPAGEKLVSVFEEHTDIIRKDFKNTYYGHKICLNGGRSTMVLDCRILEGNPSDSNLAVEAVERQAGIFGKATRQVTFDGAFASKDNLKKIKGLGSKDVVFTKGANLKVEDMATSLGVYKKLRKYRAGIEGTISWLKRSFGLDRCTWRSFGSFKSYVWGSVLAYNFLLVSRTILKTSG